MGLRLDHQGTIRITMAEAPTATTVHTETDARAARAARAAKRARTAESARCIKAAADAHALTIEARDARAAKRARTAESARAAAAVRTPAKLDTTRGAEPANYPILTLLYNRYVMEPGGTEGYSGHNDETVYYAAEDVQICDDPIDWLTDMLQENCCGFGVRTLHIERSAWRNMTDADQERARQVNCPCCGKSALTIFTAARWPGDE